MNEFCKNCLHLTKNEVIGVAFVSVFFAVLLNLLLKIRWVKAQALSIIDDTLKRDVNGTRRYSAANLTMFTAFMTVIWSFHYHIIKQGWDSEAFGIMALIATGVRVTDAWSKKLNPPPNTNLPPN